MIDDVDRILTRQEIEAARDRAMANMAAIAEEVFGPDSQLDIGGKHSKKSFPHAARTLTNLFLITSEQDQFSVTSFFDFINEKIAPTYISNGEVRERWEDNLREYNAAAEHILKALGLYQQFMGYNRSKKNSMPGTPPL